MSTNTQQVPASAVGATDERLSLLSKVEELIGMYEPEDLENTLLDLLEVVNTSELIDSSMEQKRLSASRFGFMLLSAFRR